MPEQIPYPDPHFGTATWDDDRGEWLFTLIFPSGRTVKGTIRTEDDSLHLSSPELEESRACVRWVQANELTLKQYLSSKTYEEMLDWHDPEWGPPMTQEEYCDKLELLGVNVLEDQRAFLIFNDADCFGGHAFVFSVGADGILDEDPQMWG